MKKFYLEEPGIIIEFCPENLTMSTYVYEVIESVYEASDIEDLRMKYKDYLAQGFKVYDPNVIIGTETILELTPDQELMRESEIEAMQREEFFTPKPDDWAFK